MLVALALLGWLLAAIAFAALFHLVRRLDRSREPLVTCQCGGLKQTDTEWANDQWWLPRFEGCNNGMRYVYHFHPKLNKTCKEM